MSVNFRQNLLNSRVLVTAFIAGSMICGLSARPDFESKLRSGNGSEVWGWDFQQRNYPVLLPCSRGSSPRDLEDVVNPDQEYY